MEFAVWFLLATTIVLWLRGESIAAAWSEPNLLSRSTSEAEYPALVSALGDPGMRSEKVRVAVEGWDFCNRAGNGTAGISPRWADCTDLSCPPSGIGLNCTAIHKVSASDNALRAGDPFPGGEFLNFNDPDLYALEKEKYLGAICAQDAEPETWSFWMLMLKNGNFDQSSGLCSPVWSAASALSLNGGSDRPSRAPPHRALRKIGGPLEEIKASGFPCFGAGCMNQPLVFHKLSQPSAQNRLSGGFYGTYDLDSDPASSNNSSFFSVEWYKNATGGSWNFHHLLRVSDKYPWLMLYLRADATSGPSGGYPWDTRGMMFKVPESPNFKVVLTLSVLSGGGPESQFYLLDIGGCWKNNGQQCDGDLVSDVTRYSEMIINPDTSAWCTPGALHLCPPFHISPNGTKIHRNDTDNFPYGAYHLYCSPNNAMYAEAPSVQCDPYSNPIAQEILQLLPHPEWAVHGYPASKGEGWIGDPRTWELDVGALSSRLYFYQDPGTPPAVRRWPSVDVGTEIYISNQPAIAEWVVSDFDVLVPHASDEFHYRAFN